MGVINEYRGIPTLILAQTATNSTNIAFTSDIDSTYFKYMFVFTDIGPATDSVTLTMNFSTDGGSNYNLAKTSTFLGRNIMEALVILDINQEMILTTVPPIKLLVLI